MQVDSFQSPTTSDHHSCLLFHLPANPAVTPPKLALMDFCITDEALSHLDAAIPAEPDATHLSALVELGWHLRQRDTARAAVLCQQAHALLATCSLGTAQQQKLIGRLNLIVGEAHWLSARLDEAQALAHTALNECSACGDLRGCADAHWLLATLMVAGAMRPAATLRCNWWWSSAPRWHALRSG